MGVLDTCKTEEDQLKNKQIQRMYVPATFCLYELSWNNLSSQNRKQKQNQKHIHIFRPRHSTYRSFIKKCIKLKEHLPSKVLHIYIDKILIALKAKNARKAINVKLRFHKIKLI